MTEVQVSIVFILALWGAALAVVLTGNYAASTLRHDEDEEIR